MIALFRKIRRELLSENRLSSYLPYAIGEIILVVIGILIALQINNWNEQRNLWKEEKALLMNLKTDFSANRKLITQGLRLFGIDKEHLRTVIRHTGPDVSLPDDEVMDSIGIIKYSDVNLVYGSISPLYDPYRLDILKSMKLKSTISKFMMELERYLEMEKENKKLTLELRRIHQSHIWILENGKKNSKNRDYSDPSFIEWLRDRDHQNTAVDNMGAVSRCMAQLDLLGTETDNVLELIDIELSRFSE